MSVVALRLGCWSSTHSSKSVAKLNAAIEAVTKSEERNGQAAACAEDGQQPSNEAASSDPFAQERSENASLPAQHAALPQQEDLSADRGVSSDTAAQHQQVIPEERPEGEGSRPRRRGPALLKRKCELNDCDRQSYSGVPGGCPTCLP